MKYLKFIGIATITLLISCNSNKKTEKNLQEKRIEAVHAITSPVKKGSSLPVLFTNKTDKTFLSWVTKVNDSITALNYSYLADNKWQESKEILRGNNWFVNWADYPTISENNGNLISHVLKKSSKDIYSYDIKLNVLPQQKMQWNTNLPLHTDGTKTEHGFVTILPYKENAFFITWLDGRNMASNAGHDMHGANGAMSIRTAEISAEGVVTNDILLDAKTCSCCQTTAAITNNGPVVLYRDRSETEIRDIVITRNVNGKWTAPKPIHNDNWKINGCPVNGPKIDVIGNDVAVAWFTAVNDEPKVKVVFSTDGGEKFENAIVVNKANTIGRVDISMLDNKNVIVSWMETKDQKTFLKAMKVHKSGKKSKPVIISEMNDSRKTGFPQMERNGDKMYFAWTVIDENSTSIKTVFVPIKSF